MQSVEGWVTYCFWAFLKNLLQRVTNKEGFTNLQRLQSVAKSYKVRENLLQSMTGIPKCDRKLLQSVTGTPKCDGKLLQSVTCITK